MIQALLGHEKLETTARYTRVATGLISKIESPLDGLSAPRRKRAGPAVTCPQVFQPLTPTPAQRLVAEAAVRR